METVACLTMAVVDSGVDFNEDEVWAGFWRGEVECSGGKAGGIPCFVLRMLNI